MESGRHRQSREQLTREEYGTVQPPPSSQPATISTSGEQLPLASSQAPTYLAASTEQGHYSYGYPVPGYLQETGFQEQHQHQQYAAPLYQMPGFYGEEGRPQHHHLETYVPVTHSDGASGGGTLLSHSHEYRPQLPYTPLSHFQQQHPNITPILPSQGEVAQSETRPGQRARHRNFAEPESSTSYRAGARFSTPYQQVIPSAAPTACPDSGFQVFVESMPDSTVALRETHQMLMRQTFESVKNDDLMGATVPLMELSQSLLLRVEELGLAYDDYSQQQARLQFWRNFNYCWLGLLQKQSDLSQEVLGNKRASVKANLINLKTLREMGDKLVKYCDEIEPFALVDYEQGVWEDQIIQLLVHCVKVAGDLEKEEPSPQSRSGAQEPASSSEYDNLSSPEGLTTSAAG